MTETAALRAGVLSALITLITLAPYRHVTADTLIGINGERFVGRVLEEQQDAVLFESELGGLLTIPKSGIAELRKTAAPVEGPSPIPEPEPEPEGPPSDIPPTIAWWPPTLPAEDPFDWIQLNSGEWLKGRIIGLDRETLHFDSDKLNNLELDWDDIQRVRSPGTSDLRLTSGERISGKVMVTPEKVTVTGEESRTFDRSSLVTLSPGGRRERDHWSGKVSAGLSVRSGNTRQADYSAQANLRRRTAATRLSLDYLGSISRVNGDETANNHRANAQFDVWLNRRLFLVAPFTEYFRDTFQNIGHRGTTAVGVGYDLIQNPRVEWNVITGPGYQYTWFETHAPGEPAGIGGAALVFGSDFEWELTSRLDLILTYQGIYTTKRVGRTTHHGEIRLETELTDRFDLDTSLIWDRVSSPVGSGTLTQPRPDDFRLILSLGFEL